MSHRDKKARNPAQKKSVSNVCPQLGEQQLVSHRLFLQIFASQGFRKYCMEFGTLERALNKGNLEKRGVYKRQAIAPSFWQ